MIVRLNLSNCKPSNENKEKGNKYWNTNGTIID